MSTNPKYTVAQVRRDVHKHIREIATREGRNVQFVTDRLLLQGLAREGRRIKR